MLPYLIFQNCRTKNQATLSNDIVVFHKQFYLDIETYKAIITILIKYSNYSFMTVEIFIYLLNQT